MTRLKSLHFIFGIIIVFACLHPVKAQVFSPWFEQKYVYKTWDNKSGMPQNSVLDLEKDKDGYLWIATEEGLLRFDGSTFKLFNDENIPKLYSNSFVDIANHSKGGIWAASGNTVLQIKKNVIKPFDFRKHLNGAVITQITEDNEGRLWVGSNTGSLFYIQNDGIKKPAGVKIPSAKAIKIMQLAPDGILLGTNKGLFKLSTQSHKIVSVPGYDAYTIRALALAKDGSLWVGTEDAGLFHQNGLQREHFTNKNGLNELFITTLEIAPNGDLWIGTSSAGMQIYKNGRFSNLESHTYNDGVKCILFSEPNLIWLGTTASGLIQLKPAEIQMLADKFRLAKKIILPIYQHSNGDIWIGAVGNGVSQITKDKALNYSVKDGLLSDLVLSIYGAGDKIFLGTAKGLNRFDLKTGKVDKRYTTKEGLINNVIQALYYDSKQTLWIVTRLGGIHKLSSGGKLERFSVPGSLSNAEFSSIYEDGKNNMWFGTKGSGLVCILPDNRIIHYTVKQGLPSEVIDNFYEDADGALWMGTEKGLVCFQNKKFILVNSSNGLKFNSIYRIIDDGAGFLWLSGNLGLQRISVADLKLLKQPQKGREQIPAELFDVSNGMANTEVNGGVFPAGWKMSDGSLWFPTIEGVAIIKPEMINKKAGPLNMHIESVRFGNEEHILSEKIVVPPGVYNMEIDYGSVDYNKPQAIDYFYRLKGLDPEWKPVKNRKTAYFTSLVPGKYTFEAKAQQYGKESSTATIDFEVKPFFYQSIFFKLAAILLLFLAGFLVKQLHAKYQQEKVLNILVDSRTKELIDSNNRLQIVNSTIEQQNVKLRDIAWVQSHIVRAPLVRIMGIANIVKDLNMSSAEYNTWIDALLTSANELDSVIKEIVSKSEQIEAEDNRLS